MISVKELKKILEQCDDEDYISLEYAGYGRELEHGDTFSIDLQDIEVIKNRINIVFS